MLWFFGLLISYTTGAYYLEQNRFFINTIPVIIILSLFGIIYLKNILKSKKILTKKVQKLFLVIIIIILTILSIQNIMYAKNSSLQKYNLLPEIANSFDEIIPEECYVISEETLILSQFSDVKLILAREFLERSEEIKNNFDCLLLFEENYCKKTSCPIIKIENKEEIYKEFIRNSEKYIL